LIDKIQIDISLWIALIGSPGSLVTIPCVQKRLPSGGFPIPWRGRDRAPECDSIDRAIGRNV